MILRAGSIRTVGKMQASSSSSECFPRRKRAQSFSGPVLDTAGILVQHIPVPGSIAPSDTIIYKYDQDPAILRRLFVAGLLDSEVPTPAEIEILKQRKHPPEKTKIGFRAGAKVVCQILAQKFRVEGI